jgi:AraC family transcriptional regulator
MANDYLTIEGEISAPNVTVQVRNYRPPSRQLEQVTAWPEHTLVRSLAPASYSANTGTSRFMGFGDMFLVPARIPLQYKGLGGPYRHVTCRFDKGAFETATGLKDGWNDGLLNACRNIRTPQLAAAFLRLTHEALAPSFASDMLVEALAHVMIIDLARYFQQAGDDTPKAKGGLAPWQLRRIEEHVEDVSDTAISIAYLAEICGISCGHLMRAFKQTTGETVHGYVERVRLIKAQRLLCETALPFKNIAAELGFSTPSSFSFAFRRATGRSPSSFREQLRKLPAKARRLKAH